MNNILGAITLSLVTLFAGFAIVNTANITKEAWADSSTAATSAGNTMDDSIKIILGS